MKGNKKIISEYIIDALWCGDSLRSPEITEKVSELSGKEMKIQDIASVLAKLSNSNMHGIGFLIRRRKQTKGYVYNLVSEALALEPAKLYDLVRKTGKNRYTLEQAVAEVPGLKKYIKPARPGSRFRGKRNEQAVQAKQARMPKSIGIEEFSSQTIETLIAGCLHEISDRVELNINVNIRFPGFGCE